MEKLVGETILKAIGAKLGQRTLVCGLCGGTRWSGDCTYKLPQQSLQGGGLVIGGPCLPLAALTCEACGQTLFINILRLLGQDGFQALLDALNKEEALRRGDALIKKALEEKP